MRTERRKRPISRRRARTIWRSEADRQRHTALRRLRDGLARLEDNLDADITYGEVLDAYDRQLLATYGIAVEDDEVEFDRVLDRDLIGEVSWWLCGRDVQRIGRSLPPDHPAHRDWQLWQDLLADLLTCDLVLAEDDQQDEVPLRHLELELPLAVQLLDVAAVVSAPRPGPSSGVMLAAA